MLYCRHPASPRGAFGQSSPDARRGCDGQFRAAGRAARKRTVKPCGPDPPTLVSSSARRIAERWWLKSPAHQGEHGAAVNTIAQGMPDVSAALSLLACAKCTPFCTQGSRVRPAPGIPCALLISRDADPAKTRTSRAAGMRSRVFSSPSPGGQRYRMSLWARSGLMVRDAPRAALLTTRVQYLAANKTSS
jgi:hypothetical protein